MLNRIKELSDKTLMILGLTLQLIAILYAVAVGFIYEIVIDGWKDFVFYILFFTGFAFTVLAYDKRHKNKGKIGKG